MRKYTTLSVDLIDLATFEYREGGREFENKFKDFAIDRMAFKFFNDEESLLAEKRLEELTLQYKKFFGIELESDQEINDHPVFSISFIPEYDLISTEDFVNPNKIKNKNFVNDVKEKLLVVSEKAKEFLEGEIPALKFRLLKSNKPNKNFYAVIIPKLEYPLLYKKEIELKQSQISDAYIILSDGRVNLEQEALAEVQRNKLSVSVNFKVNGQTYLSEHHQVIISGSFLKRLKEKFDITSDGITVAPFTMDHV